MEAILEALKTMFLAWLQEDGKDFIRDAMKEAEAEVDEALDELD